MQSLTLVHYAAILIGLLVWVYWYTYKDVGKFEAMGLKSVKPQFFYGNNKELFTEQESLMDFHINWYKRFPDER